MRLSIGLERFFQFALCLFIGFLLVVLLTPLVFASDFDSPDEPIEEVDDSGYLYSALLAPSSTNENLKYAPYIGSGYFICSTSSGEWYVYVPIDTKGKWGITNNGYLCNVSSSSISGLAFDKNGSQYYFNAPSFSVPRVRLVNSTSYNYTDFFGTVKDSNLSVATDFPVAHPFSEMYVYVLVGFLGVISVCLMRFKR